MIESSIVIYSWNKWGLTITVIEIEQSRRSDPSTSWCFIRRLHRSNIIRKRISKTHLRAIRSLVPIANSVILDNTVINEIARSDNPEEVFCRNREIGINLSTNYYKYVLR